MLGSSRKQAPKLSAYDKALGLLARREHSNLELKRKLAQAGYPPEAIEQALQRVAESSYQDDARFGVAMLRGRVQQGYGPLRIRVELRSHGLADSEIQSLLAEAEVDWNQLAQRQRDRHYGPAAPVDRAERQRQQQYLQRRGFQPEQIRHAFSLADDEGLPESADFELPDSDL